ncbi:MAG: ABC transporter ATP-binding protein [Thermococcus sp.]|nr:ABC transporter ATP-binding protein [Thermococcus sp.]
MYAIFTENLIKEYQNHQILKGINLKIEEGEFYALMGPNGSGKSTLASIIASVRRPTEGEVKIYGKRPELMRGIIGYLPQESFLSPLLTGMENLTYFARLMGYSRHDAKKISSELIERVGLTDHANKKVSDYSGGMKRILEIATLLFPGIKILILDEPTAGLDPSARRMFFDILKEIREEDTAVTVLMITHIGTDAEVASRVGLMDDGRIIAEGTPEELKEMCSLTEVVDIETSMKNEKILEILNKLSSNGRVLETENGYRVYCSNSEEVISEIVTALNRAGCKIVKMESKRPSLEDVFFKLTGKRLRGEQDASDIR